MAKTVKSRAYSNKTETAETSHEQRQSESLEKIERNVAQVAANLRGLGEKLDAITAAINGKSSK